MITIYITIKCKQFFEYKIHVMVPIFRTLLIKSCFILSSIIPSNVKDKINTFFTLSCSILNNLYVKFD